MSEHVWQDFNILMMSIVAVSPIAFPERHPNRRNNPQHHCPVSNGLVAMSQCHTQSGGSWSGPFGLLTFDSVTRADDQDETTLVTSSVANALADDTQFHEAPQLEGCDLANFDELFMLSEPAISM